MKIRSFAVDRDVRAHEELWPAVRQDLALDQAKRKIVRACVRAQAARVPLRVAGRQRLDESLFLHRRNDAERASVCALSGRPEAGRAVDRKSTRLNSSH